MISLGIPTLYITRRLGHSSPDMVNRVYGHLIADKQEDINRQMNEYFKRLCAFRVHTPYK